MTDSRNAIGLSSPRATRVADTAIALLVERGMRGLTHRAVDEAAGLPPGSTSNLARTRAALLELTLARLTELEAAVYARRLSEPPTDPRGLADMVARIVYAQLSDGHERTLARYELALEATRRPELRVIYDRIGGRLRETAAGLLAAVGAADPVRQGARLVAFTDGLLFDAVAGAGGKYTVEDLRAALYELLSGMLGGHLAEDEAGARRPGQAAGGRRGP
ncbi:TetR/AcrR family transcriptional regulator [Spongiactinospora gelatinilytica]|uniref:TetR/AcrR family transcriptional regulator n=1 Tax=Spongiactinospora gelatinilytica TaxID=2666298 RepID=UPI001F3389FD|nr:TetR/AcrR family transcriptional regulator [Spongiactinospora gelatinilytica]